MSKKSVLVQASHVIFDENGRPLSPGCEYSVNDNQYIAGLISDGQLSVLDPALVVEVQEEVKKAAPTKNSKGQETVPTNTLGEI